MLRPEDFDSEEHPKEFSIPVDNLSVLGVNTGPTEIDISYDETWRPLLHLGKFFSMGSSAFKMFSDDEPATICLPGSKKKFNLIVTRQYWNAKDEGVVVQARFARVPLVIDYGKEKDNFKAVILSSPEFRGQTLVLRNTENRDFKLSPLKRSSIGAYLITSNLKLDTENTLEPLQELINFLIFVKGGHCGLGNLFAYDTQENLSLQLLGFTRNDMNKPENNWFDASLLTNIPEVFFLFSQATKQPITHEAIKQTIDFYRASNASRSVSIEMSIIASHSALEAIVNYILTQHAGWTKGLIDNRSIAFSEKLRAAVAYFGFDEDTLKHSPDILKISKERGLDEFELISFFRNKLVHQDRKFIPTGVQLHEVWLVAQWLIEILIFGVIGYRGEIIDRRIYKGWSGTKCKIPLR